MDNASCSARRWRPDADIYHPGGRASTRLVVVDVASGSTRAYDVPGNVEPEAFGVG